VSAPPRDEAPNALEMARNLLAGVEAIARYVNDGGPDAEIQAHVRGLGPRQHAQAQLAAYLAVVSIAEDVHALATALLTNDGQAGAEEVP
jgi:hypothetical protein